MGSLSQFMDKAKPFLAVIFLQFGYSGMSIIGKFALDRGLSPHVLVVYRHALAFLVIAPFALVLDKKRRPKMTLSILLKIVLLGLLEPVIDQNLYYTGMKLTTATFTAAMCNILPAFAFMMAWAVRLEKVDFRKVHSLAKVLGTIVTVGGAMAMTLLKGPLLDLPWTSSGGQQQSTGGAVVKQDPIKGALMITIGCFAWSAFIILQAITLKAYPAELSLTALICLMGALEGTIPALVMERHNLGAWALHFDSKLLAVVYSGLICSAVAYYVQGLIMKVKGPVFVSAFNPLGMIIVAILGSLILSETMYLGRVIGAIIIVSGLYMVLWGKSKDQVESNDKEAPVGVKSLDVELGGAENDPRMKINGAEESD